MRTVFADSLYWIALVHRQDQWHPVALAATRTLGRARIITTEEVLVEFLNALSASTWLRRAAAEHVHRLRRNPGIAVIPQTPQSFASGFKLFEDRSDKGYSLTDCISMQTMREHGTTEVLTHDHHFEQEGFALLLRA